MAYADAYEKFIMVDIGAAGRQSDGGVFQNSEIGRQLINNELNVPPPAPIHGGVKLPYVFVGDEAFALSNFMMRPYPRSSQLCMKKRVFNYRLSRARRIIETAYGLLSNVWQVFKSPMRTSLSVTIEVTKACVCLHNFLIMFDKLRKLQPKSIEVIENDLEINFCEDVQASRTSVNTIRENFANYFMNEGAVDFQWHKAINGDF